MFISCEKCSTSFNLDDSLVKETGSKVRCSVCSHIFTAYPQVDEPDPETETADPAAGQGEEIEEEAADEEHRDDLDPELAGIAASFEDPDEDDVGTAKESSDGDADDLDDISGLFDMEEEPDAEQEEDGIPSLEELELDFDLDSDPETEETETEDKPREERGELANVDEILMDAQEEDEDDGLDLLDIDLDLDDEQEPEAKGAEDSIGRDDAGISEDRERGPGEESIGDEEEDLKGLEGLDLELDLESEFDPEEEKIEARADTGEIDLSETSKAGDKDRAETVDDTDMEISDDESFDLDLDFAETPDEKGKPDSGGDIEAEEMWDLEADAEAKQPDDQDAFDVDFPDEPGVGVKAGREELGPSDDLADNLSDNLSDDLTDDLSDDLADIEKMIEQGDETEEAAGAQADETAEDKEDDGLLNASIAGVAAAGVAAAGAAAAKLKAETEQGKEAPPEVPVGQDDDTFEDYEEDEDDADDIDEEAPKPAKKKKRIGAPMIILLVLLLLGGGAVGGYMLLDKMGIAIPDIPFLNYVNSLKSKIPSISDFMSSTADDPGNAKITPVSTQDKFVTNTKAGRLFVIYGKATNEYSNPRSHIKVTGRLYSDGNKVERTETVFCGNVLSEEELASLDVDAIKKRLGTQAGDNQSNVDIPPGGEVPFMLVFSDLPDNLKWYDIHVAGSFPAVKK